MRSTTEPDPRLDIAAVEEQIASAKTDLGDRVSQLRDLLDRQQELQFAVDVLDAIDFARADLERRACEEEAAALHAEAGHADLLTAAQAIVVKHGRLPAPQAVIVTATAEFEEADRALDSAILKGAPNAEIEKIKQRCAAPLGATR